MKERFEIKGFSDKSITLLMKIAEILEEYARQGFSLSVRQAYYQMVARGYLPNSDQSYGKMITLIGEARLTGLLDWNAIVDRGRTTLRNSHWESPSDILKSAAASFAVDKWTNQPEWVEVMVEKQALEGILEPICSELDVPFSSNKGYSSLSTLYGVGKRLDQHIRHGQRVVVLYLGDHDPSGIDMTRDIQDRLSMFARSPIDVERLALNIDQIEILHPPENPTKLSDSRAQGYIDQFGYSSWELDAVSPGALADLVRNAVYKHRDLDIWEADRRRERLMIRYLIRLSMSEESKGGSYNGKTDDDNNDDSSEGSESSEDQS